MSGGPQDLKMLVVPAATLDRVRFSEMLSETAGRPTDCIRSAFRKASVTAERADPELSRLFALLELAFDASLNARRVPDPFVPRVVFEGRRSVVPTDFTAAQLDILAASLGRHPEDPAFAARIADILWVCRHNGRRDPSHARVAVDAYVESARLRINDSEGSLEAVEHMERALRLSFLVDRRGALGLHAPTRVASEELPHALESRGLWAELLRTLPILREFEIGETTLQAEACERAARACAGTDRDGLVEQFLVEASTLWKLAGDTERAFQSTERRLDIKVEQAESAAAGSATRATGLLQEAIKIVRLLPSARRGNRETTLRNRLAELEPRTLGELGQVKHTMNVADLWQHAEDAVQGKPLLDALLALANLCVPQKIERLRVDVQKQARKAPLMHMMSASLMDRAGKVIATIPSLMSEDESERNRAARFHMVTNANRWQDLAGRAVVEPARLAIASEHSLTEADLLPLMWQSAFVPSGREGQWARGISAALCGEFEIATHLLLPQLEHALRCVVRASGNPAAGMDRLAQQEDWTLNQLLLDDGRPILESIFGADTVFDLAALLVDRTGTNLRNSVSHGLIGGRFDGAAPRYLLGVCLRLVFSMVRFTPAEVPAADASNGASNS